MLDGNGAATEHGGSGAMGAKLLAFTEIPVIDISALAGNDKSGIAATAREIGAAARNVGFFNIRGHGIPAELIERTYALSRAFHTAALDRRMEVHVERSPGTRGYTPSSVQWTDPDPELHRLVEPDPGDFDFLSKPLLHAAFDVSLELDDNDADYRAGNLMLVPNQWPAWLPEMRAEVMDYYDAVTVVGERLFRAFAIALNLPETFFTVRTSKPPSQLRLLYYPANDLPMNNTNLGIGAHSDFECFTVLHHKSAGLQVMNAANEWIDAPPIPGTFTVNIGDLLEGWTNGLFKATQHRVVNTGKERYSLPLFFAVDYDTVVEPLPQFVDAANPAAYNRIVAGKHLAGFSVNACKHLRRKIRAGELAIDFPIHKKNPFKREAVNEFVDVAD